MTRTDPSAWGLRMNFGSRQEASASAGARNTDIKKTDKRIILVRIMAAHRKGVKAYCPSYSISIEHNRLKENRCGCSGTHEIGVGPHSQVKPSAAAPQRPVRILPSASREAG